MDGQRFDSLARSLAGGLSRRRLLGALAAGSVADLVARARSDPAQAYVCRATGVLCLTDADCCTGACDQATHRCACPPGQTLCGDVCRDLQTDAHHCGACGTDCAALANVATAACVAGVCRVVACAPGTADCDGDPANGCETPLGTTDNCTDCGDACPAPPPCQRAVCTASGCATAPDPAQNGQSCGSGGQVCQDGACTCPTGGCGCPTGTHACGDTCIAQDACCTAADCPPPSHPACQQAVCAAGACGTQAINEGQPCGNKIGGFVCVAGTCACPPGTSDRGGICVGGGRGGCTAGGGCSRGEVCLRGRCVCARPPCDFPTPPR